MSTYKCINKFFLISLPLIFTGCFLLDKTSKQKEWNIDNYKIKLYSGIGLVGPRYYYYKLKKQNTIANVFFKTRKTYVSWENLKNCKVKFENIDRPFDICINTAKPIKIFLDFNNIDNIEVIRIDSLTVRSIMLNDSQKKFFADSWNKTKKYTKGSPRIKYLIKVGGSTFNSDGVYLYEQSQDAKYKISDKDVFEPFFLQNKVN
ncbi:MAG: hypothetical protein H0W73_17965 [Bacteroidetes bacterium]|nr:hypothetical protein [Bacteroidota bacterium]